MKTLSSSLTCCCCLPAAGFSTMKLKPKPLSFRLLPAAGFSTMKSKSKSKPLSLTCLPPAAAGSTMKSKLISLSRPLSSLSRCSLDYKQEANYVDTYVKRCSLDYKQEANNNKKIVETNIVNTLLQWLMKPVIAAVVVMAAAAFLMCHSSSALAASGGRMGGRSFSSRSSSSASRSSRSYSSSPSSRSHSSSPSSRSHSSSSASRSHSVSDSDFHFDPQALISIMSLIKALIYIMSLIFGIAILAIVAELVIGSMKKTSVVKLQVGLLGMACSLQKDLNKIAQDTDTSSSQGLTHILKETSLSLLRHPDYCISAYSAVDVKGSTEDAENRFDQLSVEERSKFDDETLVNVDGIKRQSSTSKSEKASGLSNEYIVITILVAVEGLLKLPAINNAGDLKEALQKLASISSATILAVEVLWTPQDEDDTLSEDKFRQDYPLLRPL